MLILFPNKQINLNLQNISFQQAIIKPGEPVLSPEYYWEEPRINMYGSVFKTDQHYEMFYQCGNTLRIGYARSEDGLNWERPLFNATDFSAKAHDIVLNHHAESILEQTYTAEYELTNLVAGYHMPSIIHEPDSDKPYKIFAFGEGGYRTLFSPNGRQFTEYPNNPAIELLSFQNPITQKYWCSDVSPCYVDKGVYHAMVKTYELDNEQKTRRCVGHSQSVDFESWTEAKTVWIPGPEEDEIAKNRGYQWADFYGLCPFRYGDIFLGYLWLFEIDHELPNGTHLGKIEVFLAYSEDGLKWSRISEKPFIPWDLNFGEEGGMVTTPSAPIFEDHAIKIYYTDSNYEHGFTEKDYTKELAAPTWVVRCDQLQKERLVGAYSEEGEISLDTSDIHFNCIRLNLDCSEGEIVLSLYQNQKNIVDKRLTKLDQTDCFYHLSDDQQALLANSRESGMLKLSIKNASIYALELLVI